MSPPPTAVEVAIIGAGVAGAATAWALRERGVTDVVVLERDDRIAAHASGRGAGLARQLVDDDAASRVTAAGVAWLAAHADAARFVRTGSWLTFDDVASRDAFAARARRLGVAATPCAVDEVRAAWPELAVPSATAALAVPGDGTFTPGELVAWYLREVAVVCGATVRAAEASGDGVRLHTDAGTYRARLVVIAAGAWADAVGAALGARPPSLTPIKRHVEVAAGDAAGRPFVWHLGPRQAYARAHADGVLLSPCDGRVAPADDVAVDEDPARTAHLAAFAPGLTSAPPRARWACHRTFGPSDLPVIGLDAGVPWLCWTAGLGSHGATTSAILGERAATAIVARLRG
ncbi:MAG: FAD-binding oxidoreductase [Kofleriaceae bacterium]